MDMADAVNVMLYASPRKDGSPGYAAWNIFRAEDAQGIRDFLRERFPGGAFGDPIHSQIYFLDTELRKELWESKHISSWRIEQKPGEAVFIPAGCAHQVMGKRCYYILNLTLIFISLGVQLRGLY